MKKLFTVYYRGNRKMESKLVECEFVYQARKVAKEKFDIESDSIISVKEV